MKEVERSNNERRHLEEMEAAQAERKKALDEAQEALRREEDERAQQRCSPHRRTPQNSQFVRPNRRGG